MEELSFLFQLSISVINLNSQANVALVSGHDNDVLFLMHRVKGRFTGRGMEI